MFSVAGDSGGPIYVVDKINGVGKYILAGTTSFGYKCAEAGYPAVYTRVAAYVDWIKANESNTFSYDINIIFFEFILLIITFSAMSDEIKF